MRAQSTPVAAFSHAYRAAFKTTESLLLLALQRNEPHVETGTCRDYAMLMIEAARALGLAARFVSGYVYNPTGRQRRLGGATPHAWVGSYLPGSG